MRRVLLAVLLVTPASVGCLDSGIIDDLRNDLEAEDKFERRVFLDEQVPFTPAGIADPDATVDSPDDVSTRWNETIRVPDGTRSLTVKFRINFTNPDPSGPLPQNPPDGQVEVFVEGPEGSNVSRSLTRTESANAGFDFNTPSEGEWTVGMRARGNGTVAFNVHGVVPVEATAS